LTSAVKSYFLKQAIIPPVHTHTHTHTHIHTGVSLSDLCIMLGFSYALCFAAYDQSVVK